MGELKLDKVAARRRRHLRIRQKVVGVSDKPRLCVHRSLKHIYAQIVEDATGRVLVSASSLSPDVRNKGGTGKNAASARIVGQAVAEKARAAGIEKVVFDRSGYLYHGRVKALAEGARENGLKF